MTWLDDLEALEQRATKGPWKDQFPSVITLAPLESLLDDGRFGKTHRLHADELRQVRRVAGVSMTTGEAGQEADNAAFIASLRNAAPKLIKAVRLLMERVAHGDTCDMVLGDPSTTLLFCTCDRDDLIAKINRGDL